MSNPHRLIDKTYLSLDQAEERGLIHRDYIAHCHRWSHVMKHLQKSGAYRTARVLDVGCGKEMPLAKSLYVNKMTPESYVGVDANDFDVPEMLVGKKIPIKIWAESDFCSLEPEDVGMEIEQVGPDPGARGMLPNGNFHGGDHDQYVLPNILTCFEVLEHVTPEHARRMLIHFGELTSPDVDMFISTPCYNGSAAGNHINEMTFAALGSLIEDLGYDIADVYGTFASISDYASELGAVSVYDKETGKLIGEPTDLRPVFAALRNYYDTNVLSTIFAPLFPSKSRNALWHVRKKSAEDASQARLFSKLELLDGPWSQHPQWKELAGCSVQEVGAN